MPKSRTPAYFAVSRDIENHPLFTYGKRRYSRREAWEWLIAHAAWKPKGHRHVFGVVDLDRGQLSASLHELAAAWRWPVTNAHRFLHRLVREDMVALAHAAIGHTGKGTGKGHRTSRHIITVCNYDKFQTGAMRAENVAENVPDNDFPQLPGIIAESASKPTNNVNQGIRKQEAETGGTTAKPKPFHGATSGKKKGHQWQWFDYGTVDWQAAVEWDREMRGVETLPRRYIGGLGNWFRKRTEDEWRAWGRAVSENKPLPDQASPKALEAWNRGKKL